LPSRPLPVANAGPKACRLIERGTGMHLRKALIAATAVAALAGCTKSGEIVVEQGVGITALRTVCPAVGVPDFLGDVTLFSPADARTQEALDVSAAIT